MSSEAATIAEVGEPETNELDEATGLPMPDDLRRLDDPDSVEDPDADLPTIGDLDGRLPIGYVDSTGIKHETFELRPYDWAIEESLGNLASAEPEMTMGAYLSEVVCAVVRRIGTFDLDKMKRGQRRLLLGNMFYADVLSLYINVRIAALGKLIKFSKFRNRCGHDVVFAGDLKSIRVKILDGVPEKVVELATGIEYAGKRRKRVKVGALRWRWMEIDDPTILGNPPRFRVWTVRNGVVGFDEPDVPEGPVVLTDAHVKSAPPFEVAELVDAINEGNGGPIMQVSGVCPTCGKGSFSQVVDWRYENFFGSSSR